MVSYPPIGTKMYTVREHRYYIPGRAAPLLEYVICEGEVTGFHKGNYVEIILNGRMPEGHPFPHYQKLSEIGKHIFYEYADAVVLAEKMTDDYERIWGWIGAPDIPMRRNWRCDNGGISGGNASSTADAQTVCSASELR